MTWKKFFKEGKELVLATCSKDANPNANIVISLGFKDDKLLIADCQMATTIKNLNENKKIVVIGGYYRIRGSVEIFTSGKYFDICTKILSAQDKSLKMKNAILVTVKEVFDLGKIKKIF